MEKIIDNNTYIDDSWGAFRTFHNVKDTINRLHEECSEAYPTLLFPTQLSETLKDYFDDPNSIRVSNVMELIAKNGNNEYLKKDWDLYKKEPYKPYLVYPEKKKAVKKIVETYYPTETKEVYEPSGCFIASLILLAFFIFIALSDSQGWGWFVLLTTVIPTLIWFFLQVEPFNKKTKYIHRQKKKNQIEEEEKKAEEVYRKQLTECEYWNTNEWPELVEQAKQKHVIELEKYQDSLAKRERYWKNLPDLIESEYTSALTHFLWENINFQVEFTEEENPRRGATEDKFLAALIKCGVEKIKRDISVNEYYPDFSIIDEYYYVDIEIDEPYIYETGEPIHYIGCGDEERNTHFQDIGAFVIRFTEDQIRHSTKVCSKIVLFFQKFAETGDVAYLIDVLELSKSIRQKRWPYKKARIMADYRYRNK